MTLIRTCPRCIQRIHTLLLNLSLVTALVATSCVFSAAAQTKNTSIEILQIVPLSGPLANVGKEISSVTQAAFTEFNKQSKSSFQLSLTVQDDGNVASKTTALAEAASPSTVALLSCFGSVGCLAQQKIANQARIPLLGAIAGAAPLHNATAGLSFPVRVSAQRELRTALNFATTTGITRMAVVVQDDGFGRSYEADLDKLLATLPQITVTKVVLNPKTPDYAAAVDSLARTEPTSLLLLANTTHSSAFLLAWKSKQAMPFVMNMAGQANALFADRLKGYTGAAAFVTMTPSPWGGKTALQRNYQRIATNYKLPISYLGFEAFMNATALIEAITRSEARTRGDLTRFLGNGSTIDLGGHLVEFGDKKTSGGFTDLALLLPDGNYRH